MRAVATLALALWLMGWSLTTLLIEAIGAPVRLSAERVELGRARAYPFSSTSGLTDAMSLAISACPRELLRSAVSLELAALDAAQGQSSSIEWQARVSAAQRLLRRGLGCFPLDGNFWLRLAMLEFTSTGPTNRVEQMLRLSAMTAPSEAWILVPRIVFASLLLDHQLPDARTILEADTRTFAHHARVADVVALHQHIGSDARRILATHIVDVGPERRRLLEAALASAMGPARPRGEP